VNVVLKLIGPDHKLSARCEENFIFPELREFLDLSSTERIDLEQNVPIGPMIFKLNSRVNGSENVSRKETVLLNDVANFICRFKLSFGTCEVLNLSALTYPRFKLAKSFGGPFANQVYSIPTLSSVFCCFL